MSVKEKEVTDTKNPEVFATQKQQYMKIILHHSKVRLLWEL